MLKGGGGRRSRYPQTMFNSHFWLPNPFAIFSNRMLNDDSLKLSYTCWLQRSAYQPSLFNPCTCRSCIHRHWWDLRPCVPHLSLLRTCGKLTIVPKDWTVTCGTNTLQTGESSENVKLGIYQIEADLYWVYMINVKNILCTNTMMRLKYMFVKVNMVWIPENPLFRLWLLLSFWLLIFL